MTFTIVHIDRICANSVIFCFYFSQPPMEEFFGTTAPHIVHPAWEDSDAFEDDSERGALMTEDEVDMMPKMFAVCTLPKF